MSYEVAEHVDGRILLTVIKATVSCGVKTERRETVALGPETARRLAYDLIYYATPVCDRVTEIDA